MKKSIFIAFLLIISTVAFARDITMAKTDFEHSRYELITMAYSYRTQPLYMDIEIGFTNLFESVRGTCLRLPDCVGIYNFEMNISSSEGGRIFYAVFDLVRRKK